MNNIEKTPIKKFARIGLFPALVALLLVGALAALPATPAAPVKPTVVATSAAGALNVSWQSSEGATFYDVGWANHGEVTQMQNAGREWLDAFHFATIPAQYSSHTIQGLQPGVQYYVIIGAKMARFGGDAPVWSPWSDPVTTSRAQASDCISEGSCLPIRAIGSVNGTGDNTQHVFNLPAGLYRFTLSGNGHVSAGMVATSPGRNIYYFDFISSTGARSTEELITVDPDDAGSYILEIDAGSTNWEFSIVRIGS